MSKNILIIDDEGLVTKSLQRLINKAGFNAVVATSGEEACVKIMGMEFHLIISDIRMPNLDGIETIKKIRQLLNENGKKLVPEILITGYADENSYKGALELKVADYVYKPFDTKEFLMIIRKQLGDGD